MLHSRLATRQLLGLALLLVAATGPACGGGYGGGGGGDTTGPYEPGPGPGPGPQPGANEVLLLDGTFNPVTRTVARGTTVTWRNTSSSEPHTVTPDGHAQFARRETSAPGAVFSQRFDTAGTFRYFCEIHVSPGAGMNGRIVVQ